MLEIKRKAVFHLEKNPDENSVSIVIRFNNLEIRLPFNVHNVKEVAHEGEFFYVISNKTDFPNIEETTYIHVNCRKTKTIKFYTNEKGVVVRVSEESKWHGPATDRFYLGNLLYSHTLFVGESKDYFRAHIPLLKKDYIPDFDYYTLKVK